MEAGVSARQPAVEKTNAAEATKGIVVGAAGGITQVLIGLWQATCSQHIGVIDPPRTTFRYRQSTDANPSE
jgi:hypothetical protein